MEVLIIGAGSIGLKHCKVLKKMGHDINFLTKRTDLNYPSFSEISNFSDFDYVIISNETSKHLDSLKMIYPKMNRKKILIENPLHLSNIFNKEMIELNKNNNIYVSYQLRFRSIISKLINEIENKKIIYINLNCSSYLPNWNRERDYRSTYSAKDELGGGVLRDVSHEIDLLYFITKKYDLNVKFVSKHKISNLEIDNEDYFFCTGDLSGIIFNINLDYISRKSKRNISLYTETESYELDLISNELEIITHDKHELVKFNDDNMDAMLGMHEDILLDRGKACKLEEGARVTSWF